MEFVLPFLETSEIENKSQRTIDVPEFLCLLQ